MEDVGRWIRRFAFAAGVALVLGASTTMWGYMQLVNAGIPSLAGVAWLPTLLAGLILVFSARAARRRVVSTWFWDDPGSSSPDPALGQWLPGPLVHRVIPHVDESHRGIRATSRGWR